jgi:hypothetical protein
MSEENEQNAQDQDAHNMEAILGGIECDVRHFDGTTERVKIIARPMRRAIEAFSEFHVTRDEPALIEGLLDKPKARREARKLPPDASKDAEPEFELIPGWSDDILPEDFNYVADKVVELNRPTMEAHIKRKMRLVADLNGGNDKMVSQIAEQVLQALAASPYGKALLNADSSSTKRPTNS